MARLQFIVPMLVGAALGAVMALYIANRRSSHYGVAGEGAQLIYALIGALCGTVAGYRFAQRAQSGDVGRWD